MIEDDAVEARVTGRIAFEAGALLEDNPYPAGCGEYRFWQQGWKTAEESKQEKASDAARHDQFLRDEDRAADVREEVYWERHDEDYGDDAKYGLEDE